MKLSDLIYRLLKKKQERPIALPKGDNDLEEARQLFKGYERNCIWCFTAGQAGQDFRGNPKYLFVYINKYRPDIKAYWLCKSQETIDRIKSLGFLAYNEETAVAQYVINRTGVLVAEQVKYAIPDGFENVKYLNLWHGVGFKNIERRLYQGEIALGIAKKYVQRGTYYRDNQLMVVTSSDIEEEFVLDCGIDHDKLIRAGYTRCLYQQNFEPISSFNHDLRKQKGLNPDAKYVVYAPTYRAELGGTFAKAIPDIERLYNYCEANNILFIFKMHPNMEADGAFLNAWETYGKRKHFWFWDNRDDFYEIMNQMDLAIVDYSAIISDMIAMGVKHYIRYVFDYDEYMCEVDVHRDHYLQRTTGVLCKTFDELLAAMDGFEERDESSEISRLMALMWPYSSGAADFDTIIDATLNFTPVKREFPVLYSFDVFDTLLSRKVLDPIGVFYAVKERMQDHGGFPRGLIKKYPSIRHSSEFCEREFYWKTKTLRGTEKTEISFPQIFARMASVYQLDESQVELLMAWELEAELENVIPLRPQIERVKSLIAAGEKVILVSDMYLPMAAVRAMLEKADPVLAELPLFLSNEYGVLKSSQKLFFEVYKSFEPYYDFAKWIHYGDNPRADVKQAQKFEICVRQIEKPEFSFYQKHLVKLLDTYDAYLVAAMQARMCYENRCQWDEFVISFVSMCFIPYIDWVLRDAERRGYKTLYFVSRDGYFLKLVADSIIRARGLTFKTKFIYGSRRVWRVPSYIDKIDEDYWESHGNFNGITNMEKLIKALNMDKESFETMFPAVKPDSICFTNAKKFKATIDIFKQSHEYHNYLLKFAEGKRGIVCDYLLQEIDASEPFAVVEYYGRGYNQDCMLRLWRHATGNPDAEMPYYYARSVLPTLGGSIRHNFTANNAKQYFIEAIFANMPYKSIEAYQRVGDRIDPVIEPVSYDRELYVSMECLLPEMATRFANLELVCPEDTDRLLFDYVFDFFEENLENRKFADTIGKLVDSTLLYGSKREFAPPFTEKDIELFKDRVQKRSSWQVTSNAIMSFTRSTPEVRAKYKDLYQILPGENAMAGRLLTNKQLEESKDYKERIQRMTSISEAWASSYKDAVAVTDVTDLILLVESTSKLRSGSLQRVRRELLSKQGFNVQVLCLGAISPRSIERIAIKLASARFILLCNAIAEFAKIEFRAETDLVLLNTDPFSLFTRNITAQHALAWKNEYNRIFGKNDFSILQIPSEHQESRFRANFSGSRLPKCDLLGSCNTDIYFEPDVLKYRKRIESLFPEACGKKLILYLPSFRRRNSISTWAKLLDLEVLKELIGEEYVVVVSYKKDKIGRYVNLGDVSGFSMTIWQNEMKARELLSVADVIVGDYRDTVFESSIVRKPTYFTASDYERVFARKVFNKIDLDALQGFEQLLFGPIIVDAIDLARELDHIEDYDYTKMDEFRCRYFTSCDGHSTERVVQYLSEKL